MTRVVVLIACHNRRETTVRCLRSLIGQDGPEASVRVLLTDDGSTDGTAHAVRAVWPGIQVLKGNGRLFWAKAMALAASAAGDYDFLLWLNDDVVLDPGALQHLLATHRLLSGPGNGDTIVVGCLRDPHSGAATYSGVRRRNRLHPVSFSTITAARRPVQAETMNGNLVLIPRRVVTTVGQIDARFSHGLADFDYGLRARTRGCTVWVAPGTLGTCPRNSPDGGWTDPALPVRERLRLVCAPKGLPPASWWRFTRRHAGPLWPMYWLSPYVRLLVGAVLTRIRHGARGLVG
ncbi:glycosyltransferase family 2 protein [Streptomyces sp. MK5]|uniref:glycosyltransferase family 2 protein n=1 Tax=Streptomyces sp. MK5 TaxID=3064253 RepID=UPI002740BAA1|nr:glycosyltransferase family 2 protein [Streptomyces sp. MK5]